MTPLTGLGIVRFGLYDGSAACRLLAIQLHGRGVGSPDKKPGIFDSAVVAILL
jgi:hypothetical protein